MIQPVVLNYDPLYVINFPLGTPAVTATTTLELGDLLSYESNALVLLDAVTENATFIGIAGGKTTTKLTTSDYIPVYLKCILEIDATSATYYIGAGLKYTSKNALVTDGAAADTLAWVFDFSTATRTRIKVLIDVPLLLGANQNIFDAALA